MKELYGMFIKMQNEEQNEESARQEREITTLKRDVHRDQPSSDSQIRQNLEAERLFKALILPEVELEAKQPDQKNQAKTQK